MKRSFFTICLLAFLVSFLFSCGELDYADREYYKQEVYIINSESTSATEREIVNIQMHTFVDTLKILNDAYDMDTIWDTNTYESSVVFKVGIGGSQFAQTDIEVLVAFDQEQINDYNILNNLECRLPDEEDYTTNVAFDSQKGGFPVVIKKGTASSSLIFTFKLVRDDKKNPCAKFLNYAIPLKIVGVSEDLEISRQYNKFMVAQFTTDISRTVNWSGYPIPSIPPGRYCSVRLQGNAAENTDKQTGTHFVWKYILPLEDPNTPEEEKDPTLKGEYMVFGTGIWSWSYWGYHDAGWMWNLLELNDEVAGTYTLKPILQGDVNFPAPTFTYGSIQGSTEDSKYDPKLKQVTLHYLNVINQEYNDVLTYVGEPVLDVCQEGDVASYMPRSWAELKSKGYKYWVPEDK